MNGFRILPAGAPNQLARPRGLSLNEPALAAYSVPTNVVALLSLTEQSDRSAPPLDLRPSRRGDGVRPPAQRHGEVAIAEHLDELATAHRAVGSQGLRRHLAASREQLCEPPDVDDLVNGLELGIREALELRQPPVQRHLAALESGRHLVAGLGALGTTAGRLALGGLATAKPLLFLVGTGSRPQVMQLKHG